MPQPRLIFKQIGPIATRSIACARGELFRAPGIWNQQPLEGNDDRYCYGALWKYPASSVQSTLQEECDDVRMYITMADLLNTAAKDSGVRVVLWYGAGDSFCAGNDLEDFLKNPMGPGDSPQSRLIDAFINFDKPIVAAVHGFAIGGGTTMLTHCDFVYASETAKFQLPFINLALVPEFGTSYSIPARIGYLRAAELIQLGQPFNAEHAMELGLVTQVVTEQELLATATATAQKLAEKPAEALQACKRLMRQSTREHLARAARSENEEFSARLRSPDTKEALTAFFEKRPPDFTRTKQTRVA